MAKLYLIRRNLETFAGPMTVIEMKDSFKRMQFGVQDEVAGHCGPWVAFDNMSVIKQTYPEIARLVNDEMLAGWGVSGNEGRPVNDETKRLAVQSRKGVVFALTFLAIAILAFVAAIYMATGARLSSKAKDPESLLRPEDLQGLIDRGDSDGFDQYLEAHSDEMVDRTLKSKKAETPWMPYLRAFAFAHDGQINGLDPKYLRGISPSVAAAPIDCSAKAWRRQWRGNVKNWNELVTGHRLVRQHWARLLSWDPYWIRHRDSKGWVNNQNYFVGCLNMAAKALDELASDASLVSTSADWDRLGYTKMKARVDFMVEVVRTGQAPSLAAPAAPESGNSLATWTCMEAAKDVPSLQRCHAGLTSEPDTFRDYKDYTEERYGWNLLRLATGSRGAAAEELSQLLAQQAPRMNKEDFFTHFDYRGEMRQLRALAKLPALAEGRPEGKGVGAPAGQTSSNGSAAGDDTETRPTH